MGTEKYPSTHEQAKQATGLYTFAPVREDGAFLYSQELDNASPHHKNTRLARLARCGGAAIALTAALAAGNTIVDADEAQALPTCYGDYCSGKYANATGCDNDASTIASTTVKLSATGLNVGPVSIGGGEKEIGQLELRSSRVCGAVWARLNTTVDSPIQFLGVKQDTGYTQRRNVAGKMYPARSLQAVSPMIYGPGKSYRAYVYAHHPLGLPDEKGTLWAVFNRS